MKKEGKQTQGKIAGIIANLVTVEVDGPVSQNEICYIKLADIDLMAEVIKVFEKKVFVQVFESTRGLKVGMDVEFTSAMLEVTLGPGILSRNYDGLQHDLDRMEGVFLKRGDYTQALDYEKLWEYTPLAKVGDTVIAGDWLGEVIENVMPHKIMVPFKFEGKFTVKEMTPAGQYNVNEVIAVLTDSKNNEVKVTMTQTWPVKIPIKTFKNKPRPFKLLETGVRTIDTMNPIVEGGTGFIPGPFGSGKTVLQHALSKQAEADIVIVAACGERANEVVEIFTEFPELDDPRTGRKLMERTTIIANTSNMPVAAREACLHGNDHCRILPLDGFKSTAACRLYFALGTGAARNVEPHGRTSRPGCISNGFTGNYFQLLLACWLRVFKQWPNRFHNLYRYCVAGWRKPEGTRYRIDKKSGTLFLCPVTATC